MVCWVMVIKCHLPSGAEGCGKAQQEGAAITEAEVERRQVPTLKQASPLRVSPERRLVLDYRLHEIACVCSARLHSAPNGSRPRRPAFSLPVARRGAARRGATLPRPS